MKRKKWTEEEEETLINKYSDMLSSGSLAKLKTRLKKFQPIAEHVNSVHHCRDPVAFPWEWTWRDASIKVQNMRHQYIGVKQKIIVRKTSTASSSDGGGGGEEYYYNWDDGENHWQNFIKYKEVFGDVDLDPSDLANSNNANKSSSSKNRGNFGGNLNSGRWQRNGESPSLLPPPPHVVLDDENTGNGLPSSFNGFVVDGGECNRVHMGDSDVLGLCLGGLEYENLDGDDDGVGEMSGGGGEYGVAEREEELQLEEGGGKVGSKKKMLRREDLGGAASDWVMKSLGLMGARLVEMRDMVMRREERQREREFNKEEEVAAREEGQRDRENQREERQREREERAIMREFEWEERERGWARREFERRVQVEHERTEEKRRRMELEERREREEMEWREQMVRMQMEHEKLMMQMQVDACQSQMQTMGTLVRLVCQIFSPGNDSLGGLTSLPPQVLHNLQHSDNIVPIGDKTDANPASHFMVTE
ncbi:hypothetical protein AMTRI_Chr06g201670 [Amborella trichopoda]|uniref:Uncharacterized protein n=1 Tax=Amborella trichopoda TaxID=13333 RepID=U5DHU2_AMBTC|nr:uncharacterized protein LOC18448505 [Amborella trichopoda]XP_020532023.1 uncharacterized protein LOC18448505 [Amborella trichopoda]ERN20098.1 hypothetical protein AMTR_s00066p00038130 [Amborella trichopoda]|eukprot:XP_020532022.1 uncharacterized protein LOC18448505 [Amborella trichopoda]